MSSVGSMNSALASEILMRQPARRQKKEVHGGEMLQHINTY